MSETQPNNDQTNETAPATDGAAEPTPGDPTGKAAAAAAKTRERRPTPIRIFQRPDATVGWTLVPDLEPFDLIDKAEKWINTLGADDMLYMTARVIDTYRVRPRKLEKGTL